MLPKIYSVKAWIHYSTMLRATPTQHYCVETTVYNTVQQTCTQQTTFTAITMDVIAACGVIVVTILKRRVNRRKNRAACVSEGIGEKP